MNAESNQFVAVRHGHPRRTNARDKLGRHPVNSEGNKFIGVQPLEVLRLDVAGEFQADIMDGHRPLLVFIYSFETERLHLLRILRVSYKVKKARSLAIVEKSLTFELSRVPRDRKMNLLPPRLGKIQPRELARRPV